MFFFYNDQFIEEEKITISMRDRGFTLGDGVFDTQVFNNGEWIEAEAHFERLLHDAIIMDIPVTKTTPEFITISHMLLAKNTISTGRWIIRTQITRGPALRGVAPPEESHPTILMQITPAAAIDARPINAIISQTTRRNEFSPLSRIKSTNYADNILAIIEAKELGAEDAVLLNSEAFVTCLTSSNIFIVEKGKWITPPIAAGVLPGITRMRLIAEKNAAEENITPERLKAAEEIWQCNSVIGLRRVVLELQ